MKPYNQKIREIREDKDLTQKEVATILKISPQYYSRYELGQNELPIRHLKTLCEFFQTSADDVLNIKIKKRPDHKGPKAS